VATCRCYQTTFAATRVIQIISSALVITKFTLPFERGSQKCIGCNFESGSLDSAQNCNNRQVSLFSRRLLGENLEVDFAKLIISHCIQGFSNVSVFVFVSQFLYIKRAFKRFKLKFLKQSYKIELLYFD